MDTSDLNDPSDPLAQGDAVNNPPIAALRSKSAHSAKSYCHLISSSTKPFWTRPPSGVCLRCRQVYGSWLKKGNSPRKDLVSASAGQKKAANHHHANNDARDQGDQGEDGGGEEEQGRAAIGEQLENEHQDPEIAEADTNNLGDGVDTGGATAEVVVPAEEDVLGEDEVAPRVDDGEDQAIVGVMPAEEEDLLGEDNSGPRVDDGEDQAIAGVVAAEEEGVLAEDKVIPGVNDSDRALAGVVPAEEDVVICKEADAVDDNNHNSRNNNNKRRWDSGNDDQAVPKR